MRAMLGLVLAAVIGSGCASVERYGAPVSSGAALPAAEVLEHPQRYDGQQVVVEGRVAEVCQSMGCWLVMQDGERSMRVLFQDHAFFVPKDSAGRVARVEGKVAVRELPVEEARHYLEDAGRSAEAAQITAPVQALTLVASGVELRPAK